MKKTFLITAVIFLIQPEAFAKVELAPYSSINFSEGVSMPSAGSALLSTNLSCDLGTIIKLNEKHSAFTLYGLRYDGPGLKKQEGRQFVERSLDHIFFLQHQLVINERFSTKERINFMKEYYRSGANEAWGKGLYDFNRFGIFISGIMNEFPEMPLEALKDVKAELSFSYDSLLFPNYTDLLKEFQISQGQATGETATGKQDQNIYQLALTVKKHSSRIVISDSIQAYTKQKVIDVTGTYGSTLQNDNIFSIEGVSSINIIKEKITFSPYLKLNFKRSNQNYLHFQTLGVSSQPPTFLGNYYDYDEYVLSTQFDFYLTKNKSIFLIPEFIWKYYTSRPAMDANYNALPEKQNVILGIYTLGYQVIWNEAATFTVFFASQQQSSSMKFEKYVPYNYSGTYFGVKFSFTY